MDKVSWATLPCGVVVAQRELVIADSCEVGRCCNVPLSHAQGVYPVHLVLGAEMGIATAACADAS